MTIEKTQKANKLIAKIESLKEDIKVLSSPNCNGLFIDVKENYSGSSHSLSNGVINEKMAHAFFRIAYINKLAELEKEFELL